MGPLERIRPVLYAIVHSVSNPNDAAVDDAGQSFRAGSAELGRLFSATMYPMCDPTLPGPDGRPHRVLSGAPVWQCNGGVALHADAETGRGPTPIMQANTLPFPR